MGEGNVDKPKVMVALRDAEHVESLVKLACQLAAGNGVIALHVVEVGMGVPLDANGEILDQPGSAILSRAQRVASGRQVFTRLARAREAGEAIVAAAKEEAADLLVLGYRRPHRAGEILRGSTVRYVARHAPCNVIVEIPALEEYVTAAKERSDWGELMEEIS
jgi:nucleotide-binding universal stress UspA family protein